MNRTNRRQLAEDTLAILDRGHYALGEHSYTITPDLAAAVAGTRLYEPGGWPPVPDTGEREHLITVDGDTTLAAARRIAGQADEVPAVLNFASAKNPGGGFLGGSQAQEESLARSSGLYPCLQACPDYYRRNRAHGSALYTDHLIYSPDVPVFRDDSGDLIPPYRLAFITAPAPNAGAIAHNDPDLIADIPAVLANRIRGVLSVAAHHQHHRLILGAWGCGVFRNDPAMVARGFAEALQGAFSGVFDHIHFAVLDRSEDRSIGKAFEQALTPHT